MRWGEYTIIEKQLRNSSYTDQVGLAQAFQQALIAGTEDRNAEDVVKVLIDYNARAQLVSLDKLFVGAFKRDMDPYAVLEK